MSSPDSQETSSTATRRSRRQAWILVTAFFAPLALAFALYYGGSWFGSAPWRPAGSTNKGELIHPARPLPEFKLATVAGATLEPQALHGKWNVVYIGDGACDARCREALLLMRQTRLALNDDMSRVQRIFLATANCCDRAWLDAEHDGLIVAPADTPSGRNLLATFPDADQGRIYVVDPLGNLMMSYGPDAPQRGLLEDLKKLMKLSHIG